MTDQPLDVLFEGGSFFEGPRWRDDQWWVSDFYRHAVFMISPAGEPDQVLDVPGQPSGLGWMPDGSLLVVSMTDRRVLRRHSGGTVSEHADLTDQSRGHLNDMVVDREGRAFVGDFGFDLMGGADPKPASLKRVDPDGSVTVVADDLLFPNGSVITPDGSTLIVGETMGSRYTAFTIGSDGSLADRRVWAQLDESPELGSLGETLAKVRIGPDGCALDAAGHIWAADAFGGRAVRIAPGGAIVDEVRAPEGLGVYACMLGGADGRTLLLCVAPDFLEHNRRDARDARLLTTEVEVPHAGLP